MSFLTIIIEKKERIRRESITMREPLARYQTLEYQTDIPFLIINVTKEEAEHYFVKNSHWHEDLEVAYTLGCTSRHYINGVCFHARPGRLVVTNSESVHSILVDEHAPEPDQIEAVVLLIQKRFLDENFPEYENLCFTNEKEQARPEIREIMLSLSDYAARIEHTPMERFLVKGLVLQLLYYMSEEGMESRDNAAAAGKNRERLKEILRYVEAHYREPIVQADVARRFYFTKEYFSRSFKQNTGLTFSEYVIRYRTQMARKDLLSSDKRIVDVALENGFSNEQRFISAFKKYYQVTPLQYRKKMEARDDFPKQLAVLPPQPETIR